MQTPKSNRSNKYLQRPHFIFWLTDLAFRISSQELQLEYLQLTVPQQREPLGLNWASSANAWQGPNAELVTFSRCWIKALCDLNHHSEARFCRWIIKIVWVICRKLQVEDGWSDYTQSLSVSLVSLVLVESRQDFSKPGHLFPLCARPGGVLDRPGSARGKHQGDTTDLRCFVHGLCASEVDSHHSPQCSQFVVRTYGIHFRFLPPRWHDTCRCFGRVGPNLKAKNETCQNMSMKRIRLLLSQLRMWRVTWCLMWLIWLAVFLSVWNLIKAHRLQMHDDGTMYRRDDSLEFARAHSIPIARDSETSVSSALKWFEAFLRLLEIFNVEVTVQQIIKYRQQNGLRAPASVFEVGLLEVGAEGTTESTKLSQNAWCMKSEAEFFHSFPVSHSISFMLLMRLPLMLQSALKAFDSLDFWTQLFDLISFAFACILILIASERSYRFEVFEPRTKDPSVDPWDPTWHFLGLRQLLDVSRLWAAGRALDQWTDSILGAMESMQAYLGRNKFRDFRWFEWNVN